MIKQEFLTPLKAYKTTIFGKDKICEVFPDLIANVCKISYIINVRGRIQTLCYDWAKLMEFKVNLAHMIYTEKYDYLDDVIIDFFKTYNYKIAYTAIHIFVYTVEFPEEEVLQFRKTCDSFKDKNWDDILDSFIDSLYVFLKSGRVHGEEPK